MPSLPQKRSQNATRQDPPMRALEGYHSTRLVNQDPRRKYVFAHLGDPDTGAQMYEYLGFEKVVSSADGVQMATKKTAPGEMILFRGHVLMSADAAEIQARWEYMQSQEDAREKQIVSNRSGIDAMRGINRDVLRNNELRFVNETKELVAE